MSDAPKKRGRKPVAGTHNTRGDWKRMRADTMRAKIAQAMFYEPKTISEIASLAGVSEDRVLPHIYATHKDCGIGYTVEGDHYQMDLPAGVNSFADVIKTADPA